MFCHLSEHLKVVIFDHMVRYGEYYRQILIETVVEELVLTDMLLRVLIFLGPTLMSLVLVSHDEAEALLDQRSWKSHNILTQQASKIVQRLHTAIQPITHIITFKRLGLLWERCSH